MEDVFGGDINPRKAARFLRNPGRLASVLQQKAPGWDVTPAEIVCDIVNVERADTKALADAHGIEIEMKLMDESRAAELIAGVTDGDAVEIIEVFNELARKRNEILQEVLDDEGYQDFMRRKTSIMHTDDPDTWDVELKDPGRSDSDGEGFSEDVDDVREVQEALEGAHEGKDRIGTQECSVDE